ncbi:hypothetical protein IC617_08295 [Neiella sp. HB171785]|uniref:Uncharacterized protein n=1 Tax=Neiella litorisoli TaxID=2771431 RepID=A0A8J6QGD1_9GAMM|nr:hypothetical protein [Neiella litorisoli]MBD1389424.1 hypothetical protein [Neiella litorisoli]
MGDILINLDITSEPACTKDMTLESMVDIAVGRWPDQATCATQDIDGEILFWQVPIGTVLIARHQALTDQGMIGLLGFAAHVCATYYEEDEIAFVATDWRESVVSHPRFRMRCAEAKAR